MSTRPNPKVRVGVVQLTSTADVEASMQSALQGIEAAHARGAKLVCLPEAVPYIGPERGKVDVAEDETGPIHRRFAEAARRHGIVLAAGSLVERIPDEPRVGNTSVVFGPQGNVLARYRKIHLFDIGDVGDGFRYRESSSTAAGSQAVVVDTACGRLGLSVCFDLRFPGLYNDLSAAGADILLVPSAFTVPTGRDHWSVLLRARAIETQCFVVAAAQTGVHSLKRHTYGHSMVVDPWGRVLLELGRDPDVGVVDLALQALHEARERVPTLTNRRSFTSAIDSK